MYILSRTRNSIELFQSPEHYFKAGGRSPVTEKGGMTDDKSTFGDNDNAVGNLDAVGLFLAGRR
jgi:hypothetical protein